MEISFLQLNFFKGEFLDTVIRYIQENSIDIVSLQEVTGGSLSFDSQDCFSILKNELGYNGELVKSWKDKNDASSYFGNATFFKPEFVFVQKDIVRLKEFKEVDPQKTKRQDNSSSVLSLLLQNKNSKIRVVNTHLVWGPNGNDDANKLIQGKVFYEYLKTLKDPIIVSGDFNVAPHSKIVSWVSSFARCLTLEYRIQNTLNPRVHYAKELFPKGLAVDYIFTSKKLFVKQFEVLNDLDLSDHLGLKMELTI